ncbi:MAG TPA: hypothetical protein DIW31_12535 [Bacteroidales bacterium]|nr:hypothetical protein [Bacteroidales bacterium]
MKVNQNDLLTAIRCYFEVEKKFNVKNYIRTKFYLGSIAEKRGFFIANKGKENLEAFEYYLKGDNIRESAKKSGLGIRDCSLIVNTFLNAMISEVLEDKKQGSITEMEFIQRKRTKRQIIKKWNDYMSTFSHENDVKSKK